MSIIYAPGVTSKSIDITIVDDTGIEVTGLVAATFPALTYSVAGANADVLFSTTAAFSDLATLTTAFSACGIKERGNGVYRVDVPDTAWATAGTVKIRGGSSGKRVIEEVIDVSYPQVDARQWLGGTIPAVTTTGVPKVDLFAILGTTLTETAGYLAGAFKKFFNIQTPTLTTGGTDQTGDSYAVVNSGTFGNAQLVRSTTPANTLAVDSSHAVTFNNTTIATATNLTNAPGNGDFTAAMKTSLNAATPASVVGAVGSVTGAVGSVTGNVGGNVAGSVGSINGITFPTHFSILAIDGSGDVTFNNAGISTLDAAGVRTAVGLGAANLDTQLNASATAIAAVESDTTNILSGLTTLASGIAATITKLSDGSVVVGGFTTPALQAFIITNTGKVFADVVAGSVAMLSQGEASSLTPSQIAAAVIAAAVDGTLSLGEATKRINALIAGTVQGPPQLASGTFTANDNANNPYLTVTLTKTGLRTTTPV